MTCGYLTTDYKDEYPMGIISHLIRQDESTRVDHANQDEKSTRLVPRIHS